MARSPSDDERFRRVFADYHEAIQRYCARRLDTWDDANDAAAEVFLVVWRRVRELPRGDEAKLWIYGIARNTVKDFHRKQRRWTALRSRLARQGGAVATDPAVQVVRRSEDERVLAAVQRLRPLDREVLQLREWDGLSHTEIGSVLGVEPHAVEMRRHRALRRLARLLEHEERSWRHVRMPSELGVFDIESFERGAGVARKRAQGALEGTRVAGVGDIVGRARVIHDADGVTELEPGEIVTYAETTDQERKTLDEVAVFR